MAETSSFANKFDSLTVIPVVTFDINLGKLVKNIDFDYVGYDKHLRDRGLEDEQIDQGSVEFWETGRFEQLQGSYGLDTHRIFVGIHKRTSQKDANAILKHEAEHMVEHFQGKISEADVLIQQRAWKNAKRGERGLAAGVTGLIAGDVLGSGVIAIGGLFATVAGGASFLHAYRTYKKSAHEKRANEGSTGHSEFVTFCK